MENNNNDKDYNLYTEHVVKEPWKAAKRRLKKAGFITLLAVIFGVIAGLVMLVVYKVGKGYIDDNKGAAVVEKESHTHGEKETDTKPMEPITISPVETEVVPTEPVTELQIDDEVLKEYAEYYKSLKAVTEKVQKSMVTVSVSRENIDWFNTTYQNISEDFGIVVSADDNGYYVLTDYSLVRTPGNIVVTYPDGSRDTAKILAGDTTTDLAIIKTGEITNKSVSIANFGDSSATMQGDLVVAVGKLYGFAGSIGYGITTGVENIISDTDSAYQLINTNISGNENATGIIVNLRGEIIGMITTAYNSGNSSPVTAYASNGISPIIEMLINGKRTAYLGVRGQEITADVEEKYNIPKGIYVSTVESNSPAYQAGIQTGDVLFAIADKEINTMTEFMEILRNKNVDDKITLMIKRKGRDEYKEIEFDLMLGVE